jgi:hypothetical protein
VSADHLLLEAGCSERSLTHQLAVHLARRFPIHHVDCEYNRDGFNVKKLELEKREVHVDDNALDAVTVLTDVVVLVRGRTENNLLVMEVKKASSPPDHSYDINKLRAFKGSLDFMFAAHLVLGFKRDGTFIKRLIWQ